MRTLLLAAALMGAAVFAQAQQAPAQVQNGALVGPNGMTLYVFDNDEAGSGKSACNGPCIGNWPAFPASASAKAEGDYTVVARDDGTHQWAYKGKPLYFWAKDAKPGDRTGDGVKNAWHVATP
jgi:predicted lipoprotein with Yx(FWY)xxD motif